jgi:hypothetical protein
MTTARTRQTGLALFAERDSTVIAEPKGHYSIDSATTGKQRIVDDKISHDPSCDTAFSTTCFIHKTISI